MTGVPEFPSLDALRGHEAAARQWMTAGVASVLSLWNPSAGGTFRHTDDIEDSAEFRPTATFHAIVALAECGVWHQRTRYDERRGRLVTPYGDVVCHAAPPGAASVLRRIVESDRRTGAHGGWLTDIIKQSSHIRSGDKKPSSRSIIPLERLISALSLLLRVTPGDVVSEFRNEIIDGLSAAAEEVRLLLMPDGRALTSAHLYHDAEFSPAILFNAMSCINALRECHQAVDEEPGAAFEDRKRVIRNIRDAALRHVDFHMARQTVALDPSYDPVSLAFALRAVCIASPEERRFAFFRACLDAIVGRQHQDGCWPDGVSITFEETADVVQQPSVGVALLVAECAIDNTALTDNRAEDRALIGLALPALRRTLQYLQATYTTVANGEYQFTGWSSDRVRRRNYIETWITALSTRLLRRLWIGERASLRSLALVRLGLGDHTGTYHSLIAADEAWRERIVDPDEVTKPTHVIFTRVVKPILAQRDAGDILQKPQPDSVSFIIFGPPGSGKTFFVQSLADFLGWPLVTITPGHFIYKGLEFIEAVAREIFDYLRLLNHAVVFFDECDELFRSRGDDSQRGARSILSFATASMLPKLQDLHDAANVVFVLGTNYLRNLDTAIRRPGRFDEILLFDRPDDRSRELLAARLLGSDEQREIHRVGKSAAGLTVKEVFRFAAAAAARGAFPTETSIDDYRDWCQIDGTGELNSARFSAATKEAIRLRWSRFTSS